MLIRGSCHCGGISFRLDWRPETSEIPARACSCSFCMKHGGLWTSCRSGSLEVRFKDAGRVSRYAFGTKTAVFHVCSACGAVPVVTSEVERHLYAVVNVNAFDAVDPSIIRRSPVSFDQESEADRLARRARNWIADVEFSTGAADP